MGDETDSYRYVDMDLDSESEDMPQYRLGKRFRMSRETLTNSTCIEHARSNRSACRSAPCGRAGKIQEGELRVGICNTDFLYYQFKHWVGSSH